MIKKVDYYKNSKIYKEGISVSIQTLNAEDRIKRLLDAIKKEEHDEIIICDHNSNDKTVEIAKSYTDKIIVLDKSIGRDRSVITSSKRTFKYMFSIETDQFFDPGIITKLKEKLIESEDLLISGQLIIKNPNSYLEKFMQHYYYLNNQQRFPGTPFLTYTEFYKNFLDEFNNIADGGGYDTSVIDIFLKNKIPYQISNLICFQEEDYNIKSLSSKFFWYGEGDYNYFQLNKNRFSFREKVKSLSHVFRKYFLKFPLKTILIFKLQFIVPLFLVGLVRYSGFISKFFIKKI